MPELHVRLTYLGGDAEPSGFNICIHDGTRCRGVRTFPRGPGSRAIVAQAVIDLWATGEVPTIDETTVRVVAVLEE